MNSELIAFSPGFVIIPIKSPIVPAKNNIPINVNIIFEILILQSLLEDILIILQVTDENIIGITDIDIKVKNILLSGVSDFPISGKQVPTKIAHIAPMSVE